MDERVYWIWIQHGFGEGSPMPWRIHQSWPGGVRGFYEDGPRAWNSMPSIREKEAAALYSFSLEEAQAQLEYAERVNWQVITPECEKYPLALRNIFDPPAVLYGKGSLPDVDRQPTIAVVGARKAQKVSEEKAKEFSYQLAIGGAAVVTGGAVGIDAAAILGAMSGEGPVVSVLPVALNSSYPSRNAFLRQSLLERGGALLTEYFSQQTPSYGTFQVRNRLITGLACGVLLLQAAQKSGTMLYAAHAKDQNRDVFVWPGACGDAAFAGGRGLIEDGAKAVERGEDILMEYSHRFWKEERVIPLFVPQKDLDEQEVLPALADPGQEPPTPLEEAVLAVLTRNPQSAAQLEEQTGLPAGKLLGVLTELELRGVCRACPGGRYCLGEQKPQKSRDTGGTLALTGEQALVLTALEERPRSVAQLEECTGLPAGKLLGLLTELELQGLCQSCPGKRYRRT